MLFEFQNLTSFAKQKRRFSRYNNRKKASENFEDGDFEFIDVLLSNKIVESKEKVNEIKKDQVPEDHYEKVF